MKWYEDWKNCPFFIFQMATNVQQWSFLRKRRRNLQTIRCSFWLVSCVVAALILTCKWMGSKERGNPERGDDVNVVGYHRFSHSKATVACPDPHVKGQSPGQEALFYLCTHFNTCICLTSNQQNPCLLYFSHAGVDLIFLTHFSLSHPHSLSLSQEKKKELHV